MNINEEFVIHETLNPKLFNVETNTLLPDVREKIVQIVDNFESYIEVPIHIVDIQLVGSNVSYNYTDTSDLDVHIIANFEMQEASPEILAVIYNMKKSTFNREFDISIHGIEVEMYVQDIRSNIVSNGIYSICDNKWIKEPKPIKSITKHNVDKELSKWSDKIQQVLLSGSYEEISDVINNLYLMRTNSIATDGEYGKGNEIFKTIRSSGMLSKLKDALSASYSKRLSLESYTPGQLVNRFPL